MSMRKEFLACYGAMYGLGSSSPDGVAVTFGYHFRAVPFACGGVVDANMLRPGVRRRDISASGGKDGGSD